MKKILLHAWAVQKKEDKYYLPYTHGVYLNEIVKYYDKVTLLSSVSRISISTKNNLESLECFHNIDVIELPPSDSYVGPLTTTKGVEAVLKTFNLG